MDGLGVDTSGFQLIELPGAVPDQDSTCMRTMQEVVYPMVAAKVKQVVGARGAALVFDHILRDEALLHAEAASAEAAPESAVRTPHLKKPVYYVHADYTMESGYTRARQLLEPHCTAELIDEALRARFAMFNVWIPLQPVQRDPLGLVLWNSVRALDVQRVVYDYEHRSGQIYDACFSPAHQWAFFPRMEPGEAILFKSFDSEPNVARFALHGSLDLDELPEAAPARRSIELRLLVFYDSWSSSQDGFAAGFVPPHLIPGHFDADAYAHLRHEDILPPRMDEF